MDFLASTRRKTAWVLALAVAVGGVGLGIALWGDSVGLACGVPCMALVMLTLYSRNAAAPLAAGAVAVVLAGICFAGHENLPELALTLS
ncbi:MAG: hypothetical protein RBU21_06305, partial [FCB group bacterium]|nr:hypothetical protein [FCB group bacterium]